MITFETDGQLGNKLFQYTIARLLAEKLGFSLGTTLDLKGTITPTEALHGSVFLNDKTILEEWLMRDENVLEKNYDYRHYHLKGFWQRAAYYIPNRTKILKFFKEKAPNNTDKDNIIMHVRLNDYKIFGGRGGCVLNPKYYLDCLEKENFNNLYIVTDEPNDSYFNFFGKYNPIFPKGSEKEDFWLITNFDRIIIGNSTFSWWAAFLSNASKIYTPACWLRYGASKVDLHQIANGVAMPANFMLPE